MKTKYDHRSIQKKWDKAWKDAKIYQPDLDTAKNPYYVLYMFPYPSAEGLHVGHAFSGTGADVYARFMRMKGFDVFHPMGFDAFGIHSENYALKINDHPKNFIDRATKHFREQFDSLGFSYDWNHSVNTSSPDYYKWTQWLFIQLFKSGLAEKKKAEVNWCPSCKTVLADEQVLQKSNLGVCERCGTEVEMRELEQWFFKITDYADRLLEGLDRIDWTEKVKLAQRNWIGKKEGINIKYRVLDSPSINSGSLEQYSSSEVEKLEDIEVFTTKPETIDGATFLVVSPQHRFVVKLLTESRIMNHESREVREYVERARKRSERDIEKEKTGIFSGLYAVNPATKEEIPIWIADYVLMDYGTGAIMGVPFADERDKEFAKEFDLPIIKTSFKAKPKGEKRVHYHLRDWLISRQRYWGAPIPMVFCKSCAEKGITYSSTKAESRMEKFSTSSNNKSMPGWFPVPGDELPVLLPYIENFKPLGSGVAPLAQDENFVNTKCPNCGGPAKRETDVCDTFLDSSWYFLRYPSVGFDEIAFDKSRTKKWLPVNSYIGGAEHSVLHLLYSRFITKVLFDLKFLEFDEPFTKFRAHGLIIKDGAKMSKSRGNVVSPDEYVNKYGADALRCYLMFLGPFDQGGDFRDSGIEGMERFLKRARKLVAEHTSKLKNQSSTSSDSFSSNSVLEKSTAKAIKGVGEDVENLRYNTAIAKIMEFVNDLTASKDSIGPEQVKTLVILMAPFAPYLTEELWQLFQNQKSNLKSQKSESVHAQAWPEFDESKLSEDEVTIAVQVNGKLRSVLRIMNKELSKDEILAIATKDPRISKYIEGKQIKNVIYVEGKILNFVIENG